MVINVSKRWAEKTDQILKLQITCNSHKCIIFFLVNVKLNLKVGTINLEEELKEHWDITFSNDVLVRLLTKFNSNYFEKKNFFCHRNIKVFGHIFKKAFNRTFITEIIAIFIDFVLNGVRVRFLNKLIIIDAWIF